MCKQTHEIKFAKAIYNLQETIKPFIKLIIEESYSNPDDIYLKMGLEQHLYKIGLFNKKTEKIIVKHYSIGQFLELASEKNKFKFVINMDIREMLVKLEETSGEKVINM